MSQKDTISKIAFDDNKKIIVSLILVLVGITVLYQSRPFLDDSQFSYIAIPAYAILPGLVTAYASVLAIKLYKQKNYQAKGFALFAVAAAFWFIAEQIWQLYDHIWEGAPFPSEDQDSTTSRAPTQMYGILHCLIIHCYSSLYCLIHCKNKFISIRFRFTIMEVDNPSQSITSGLQTLYQHLIQTN